MAQYKNIFANYNQVLPPEGIEIPTLHIQEDDIMFPEQLMVKQTEESPVQEELIIEPIVTTPQKEKKKTYDHTISLEQLLKNIGANARITSGYRHNSKTKQGRVSHHSRKDQWGQSMAHDIVAIDGDFEKLKKQLIESPEAQNWFAKRGYGVLDETTSAMLAKTGGTGKHFHIGPDQLAIRTWNEWNKA